MNLTAVAKRLRKAEREYSAALAEHDGSTAGVVRYQAARDELSIAWRLGEAVLKEMAKAGASDGT
jgi:hypothetical protein